VKLWNNRRFTIDAGQAADLARSIHRPGFMIVLSPSTAMMIKKKMKDTMRKNVLRSPVIMMIHLLCS
jgi:hypothetical protein